MSPDEAATCTHHKAGKRSSLVVFLLLLILQNPPEALDSLSCYCEKPFIHPCWSTTKWKWGGMLLWNMVVKTSHLLNGNICGPCGTLFTVHERLLIYLVYFNYYYLLISNLKFDFGTWQNGCQVPIALSIQWFSYKTYMF